MSAAAIVFGVGPVSGVGGAVAIRAAAGGMPVYVAGRHPDKMAAVTAEIAQAGGSATALACDATVPAEVEAVFAAVAAAGHVPGLVVFNVGGNWPMNFLDITPEFLEGMWRQGPLAGLLVGQAAVRALLPAGGTLIFTGASASLRGKPMFAAFASAKAGLRAIAQSMAREFGPQGLHVAHVVIDGVVAGDRVRGFLPGLIEGKGEDATLDPAAIAETYWQLHLQPRSAWTHELELRPFVETW
ncbi:SDR family NAD(P)-dependent oxidoreductase [Zavarzinia compransoris]|uniref:Glucose 1-dehydrogenase n=1 Tax=Zavarzinia compransoris TaxID=1264899 RepID=A0A317DY79_9PROT|nr:SDR family NAD(P)-dependent oxidoreductase [Zavarzinia compransoris]PWR18890.1 glucose 1-dehydrogenase [Zavarzinia compransoris]TDP48885.1 NADP-dependent 3-hydroxy acid dehydrogenase YdfG [Zavarzinia compransoris]